MGGLFHKFGPFVQIKLFFWEASLTEVRVMDDGYFSFVGSTKYGPWSIQTPEIPFCKAFKDEVVALC